ncbi:deoxyribose-phosphate aldolase 2, partial [Staphylococcus aureus W50101]
VKTSTGFAGGGATAEDVKLMKDTVGADVEVKLVRAQAFKLCKV